MTAYEEKIKSYWAHTPAVVVVKKIKRRAELPKWEDCPKDHIYVGIQRGAKRDKIIVVKHKIEGVFGLNCKAEELSERDWDSIGVKPTRSSMTCVQCGEFSTRMNIGGICNDCTDKSKVAKS